MRAATVAVLAALVGAVLGGCGGGDEPTGDARKGGSVTVGTSQLPRVLDPALATEPLALQILRAVYTPPLTYGHDEGREGTELAPGLVREMPEVSEDGLVYSFRFRAGLRYSNGVRLRASDFERAVDRARSLSSPQGGLLAGIVDIEADDRSGRVEISLARPDPAFAHSLALPVSAPVPEGIPSRDLSDRPPPGIGPYTFEGVRAGERVVLGRANAFQVPDLPGGNVDAVTIERAGSPESQAAAVIAGTALDLMQELPPVEQLPEIRSEYAERYEEETTASTLFLAIDPTAPPFDDETVRHAVSLAVDGPTLERLYAGRLDPGCNLVPSSVSGHRRLDPCPHGDRSEPPDLVRARQLVEEAGQEGAVVTVGAADGAAPPAVLRSFVRTLRKIGLAAREGRQRTAITFELIAPPVAHASAYLAGFSGRTGDFELDAEIEALLVNPEADEGDWAEVDERLVEEAYAAPLGSPRQPTFFSERVDVQGCATFHPLFWTELAGLCLR
jgi:peptide/nickel transport system substrate-binding protein